MSRQPKVCGCHPVPTLRTPCPRSCKPGARTYTGGEPVAFATRKAMAMSSQLRWASMYSSTAVGIDSV
jgi:hypothetical protein